MIYFMRAGPEGPVKIGWNKDAETLKTRQSTLQTGQPFQLVVVRTMDTPRWTEAWLHGFFSGVRAGGEWFTYRREMLTIEPPGEKPPKPVVPSAYVMVRIPADLWAWVKSQAIANHRSATA